MPDRSDSQYLEDILATLKKMNNTLIEIRDSISDNTELLTGKISILESVMGDARDTLKDIENNTTP